MAQHASPPRDATDPASGQTSGPGRAWLLGRATALHRDLVAAGSPEAVAAAVRLADTVVRPLRPGDRPADPTPTAGPDPGGPDAAPDEPTGPHGIGAATALALLELAEELTRACATDPDAALLEACAGAHHLLWAPGTALPEAVAAAAGSGRTERLASAAAALPPAPAGLRVRRDGPYLVTGAVPLTTWLGEELAAPPVAALCRCGRSGGKPWCDGSHARTGFTGDKHPDRVPDRVDRYPSRGVDLLDNRGLCAHSGRCTDLVPGAFHTGGEPFVTPSGARQDDLLRAVRACPSGALGAALAGAEARAQADSDRPASVEVSRDGPYRVTGGVGLADDDGTPVPRPGDASPEHYSLCRCGMSANKPFCSGAHWYADFHDPVPDPDADPTLFAWAGGYPALLRLTTLFYERHVPQDELIGPLFARMRPDHPERVATWLSEVFGGPERYTSTYGGYSWMISQHLGKHLTEPQRARWVALMARSADEAGLPADPEFRAAFVAYLEWGSRIAVENSTDGARPPAGMPVPHWWWVCNATPSARVPSLPRPDAAAPPVEQAPPPVPGPDEPVGFATHVRGLFRAHDRGAMRFAFDLWSAEDVRAHAAQILDRLRAGTMPCDGAWPAEQVAIFSRWVDGGCRE